MKYAKARAGRLVERCADLLLARRKLLLTVFLLLTLGLGYSATHTQLDPGFNKQIPVRHDYMLNFLEFSQYFTGANRFLVSVRWKGEGDIYNPEFLDTLRKVTDDVFFINGVSRASVTSLFTANVRYIEITEEGFLVMWWYRHALPPASKTWPRYAAMPRARGRSGGWWPMT